MDQTSKTTVYRIGTVSRVDHDSDSLNHHLHTITLINVILLKKCVTERSPIAQETFFCQFRNFRFFWNTKCIRYLICTSIMTWIRAASYFYHIFIILYYKFIIRSKIIENILMFDQRVIMFQWQSFSTKKKHTYLSTFCVYTLKIKYHIICHCNHNKENIIICLSLLIQHILMSVLYVHDLITYVTDLIWYIQMLSLIFTVICLHFLFNSYKKMETNVFYLMKFYCCCCLNASCMNGECRVY